MEANGCEMRISRYCNDVSLSNASDGMDERQFARIFITKNERRYMEYDVMKKGGNERVHEGC